MSIIAALIGPIEYWWDTPEEPDRFNSPAAEEYRFWRQAVNDLLVADGWLVYRPHEGFKGAWDERAQVFNDEMIKICDVVICMRPPGIPGRGTDHELELAGRLGKPIIQLPPGTQFFAHVLREHVQRVSDPRGKVVSMSNPGAKQFQQVKLVVDVWVDPTKTDATAWAVADNVQVEAYKAVEAAMKGIEAPDHGIEVCVR